MTPPAKSSSKVTPKKSHDSPMTKSDIYFALDCEMVGVGEEGLDSAVARITIVNWENVVVLDTFVKVPVPVTDYRTYVSGITAQDIESDKALSFEEARQAVTNIIGGKILIGHGLENDMHVLGLAHPVSDVRDTACYLPYMKEIVDAQTGTPVIRPRKLRDLTREVLGREIQLPGSPHSPIDDAIAALDLYKVSRYDWEKELSRRQREKAQEDEKAQERRWRYNFWWSSQQQQAPAVSNVYNPNDPAHNMHYLPMPHDPRLQITHPYAVVPGYAPMPPHQMAAPPPPPPPPPSKQSSSQPTQQQQQQSAPSSTSSSWFRFGRPKTPPMGEKKVMEEVQTPTTASDVSFSSDPISDEASDVLPEMECLTLESKSRSLTTVASQETVPREDVLVSLPFYSEGHGAGWD